MYIQKREIHELYIDHDKRDELLKQEIDVNIDDIFDAAGKGQFKGMTEVTAPVMHQSYPRTEQDLKSPGDSVKNVVPSLNDTADGDKGSTKYGSVKNVKSSPDVESSEKDINDDSHYFSPRLRELLASYGHKT